MLHIGKNVHEHHFATLRLLEVNLPPTITTPLSTMEHASSDVTHKRFRVMPLLWTIAIVAVSCFVLWPSFSTVRHGPGLNDCYTNFNRIARAIISYRDEHGHYPPPFVADADGEPMHSWRVLILPHMGYSDIFEKYDFDEPWNGPSNSKLATLIPSVYRCPESESNPSDLTTSYLAVTGPKTMWTSDRMLTEADVIDGLHETALLTEFADNCVHWMSPEDMTYARCIDFSGSGVGGPSSKHSQGRWVVAYADGYVQVVDSAPTEVIRAMFTVNGQEAISMDSIQSH
jgi:hypothetical protein